MWHNLYQTTKARKLLSLLSLTISTVAIMKLSMFSWLVPIVMAALLTGEARAWGTKTEDQKKSDRFFKCLLAIEGADIDQDNRLDSTEYDTFVDHYSVLLFDESMSKVPKDIQSLYKALVAKSEAPKGEDLIDVFGANFFDVRNLLGGMLA